MRSNSSSSFLLVDIINCEVNLNQNVKSTKISMDYSINRLSAELAVRKFGDPFVWPTRRAISRAAAIAPQKNARRVRSPPKQCAARARDFPHSAEPHEAAADGPRVGGAVLYNIEIQVQLGLIYAAYWVCIPSGSIPCPARSPNRLTFPPAHVPDLIAALQVAGLSIKVS